VVKSVLRVLYAGVGRDAGPPSATVGHARSCQLNILCSAPSPNHNLLTCTCSQSDAHKDGTQSAATARPSVLVRRTTRIGVPVPLSSSRSFTTAMTHQPSAATVGGPLGLLPVPSRRTRTTAEQLLPSLEAAGNQHGEVRQEITQGSACCQCVASAVRPQFHVPHTCAGCWDLNVWHPVQCLARSCACFSRLERRKQHPRQAAKAPPRGTCQLQTWSLLRPGCRS